MGSDAPEVVDGFMKEDILLIKGRPTTVYSKWIWGTPSTNFHAMVGAKPKPKKQPVGFAMRTKDKPLAYISFWDPSDKDFKDGVTRSELLSDLVFGWAGEQAQPINILLTAARDDANFTTPGAANRGEGFHHANNPWNLPDITKDVAQDRRNTIVNTVLTPLTLEVFFQSIGGNIVGAATRMLVKGAVKEFVVSEGAEYGITEIIKSNGVSTNGRIINKSD